MQHEKVSEVWSLHEGRTVQRMMCDMNESKELGEARIAITSTGKELESPMDPRFGRCAYFVIVDGAGNMSPVSNDARDLSNGAGIQAAKNVVDLNVEAVITGDVGPNAFRVLSAAGVRIYVGGSGTIREALERFKSGQLREAASSTAPGHHGMGGGRWGNRQ